MNKKILFIDDDESLNTVVSHQLEKMGYAVQTALTGETGLEFYKKDRPDLVLLDFQLPGMNGLTVLKEIRKLDAATPVVIATAYGTIDHALDACRKGADDYLTKPFSKEQLGFAVEKALRFRNVEKENRRLQQELGNKFEFGKIITQNSKMQQLLDLANRAAQTEATVLIQGESGTGKELLARAVHYNSPRSDAPFVAVNCPSIPEHLIESELFGHEKGAFTGAHISRKGKFELADSGTLFLDEIGDLRLDLQSKLLRALQEQEIERVGSTAPLAIDVRIIAATNCNLSELVQSGEFREDLYYRLNVLPLNVPPLRNRIEDIPLLVNQFVIKYAQRKIRIADDFIRALVDYHWPGNIRELENAVQRAVVLCRDEELNKECFMPEAVPTVRQSQLLPDIEKQAIGNALQQAGGNQTLAAKKLGIARHVLLYRMKKYNL